MTTSTIHRERVPLETADVGAELLDILSRGLYTDPFDAVREYVQNAVDAGASEIIITHTGTALLIRDDGSGMGWEDLKNARRFGVSVKDATKDIGFRGIGIYSSYGIAGKLRFLSRKLATNEQYGMEIDFASIKQRLDRNRQTQGRRVAIPLADMLYDHSEFTRQAYGGQIYDPSFTLVSLEDIDPAFREKLADRDKIRDYLLKTVHVRFTEDNHGAEVNRLLEQHLGIKGVTIRLRYHGHENITLERRMPVDVSRPQAEWLTNDNTPNRVAFIWHTLTNGRGIIPGDNGFILKLKSITLGERDDLKFLWPPVGGGTLHNWHFGEVHVLDAAGVVPNAARNGLEPGIHTELLHAAIQRKFTELNGIADTTRGARRARDSQEGLQKRTEDLRSRASETNANPAEIFSEAIKLKNEIEEAIRTLQRTTRGRYARKLSQEENEVRVQLDDLKRIVQPIEYSARRIAQAAISEKPTNRPRSARPIIVGTSKAEVAPLQVELKQIVSLLRSSLANGMSIENDLTQLEDAANAELLQRFFPILDALVARNVILPELVEEARRRLRGRANLEPDGPITLLGALARAGFEPASQRERIIIERLDESLLEASGGRELSYYRLLHTIAGHDFENGIPLL